MKIKVGSLFDGIGGTPLAAIMSGAEPVWASEIEKIPVSITERHFPNMKHYGDVTQINGAEIEPVDLIVGGSPCQDLSVAGKRAGLEGERSGLFMDQVRIVKEMRNATRETADGTNELPRPRYMVWENVLGTFSSNKGEDFRAVLEEVCRIGEEEVSIPRPPKGKWSRSGSILGDGYSVAWRTVDAQHWGVPQRRRRIYLVADFGGRSAPEICFERESLSGDTEESGEAREGITTDAEGSSGSSGELVLNDQGGSVMGVSYGVTGTLRAEAHGHQPIVVHDCKPSNTYSLQGNMIGRADHNGPQGSGVNEDVSFTLNTADRHAVCYGISSYHSNSMKSSNPHSGVYEAETSRTIDQNGGNPACNQGGIAVVEPVCFEPRSPDGVHRIHGDISPTLNTMQGGQRQPRVVEPVARTYATQSYSEVKESEQGASLRASGGAYGGGSENYALQDMTDNNQPERKYIVRRLTPLECERLQGFPDGWTQFGDDGKEISDTQRYKALGNSFAMPNAFFFISRVIRELRKENNEP